MLDSLKSFLAEFHGGEKPLHQFDDGDYRLAAAALLVHIMSIDGEASVAEKTKLRSVLQKHFSLNDDEVDALIVAATQADHDAIDLYHFTSRLNRALDEEGRLRMVEMMWEIVYADGERSEFEDNIVWRAADLLGISGRERIALRQRVSAGRASDGAKA